MLDNHSGAKELWLRSGFQWDINNNVSLKSQVYGYDAQRHWFNNEINSFNDSATPSVGVQGDVYRERLALDHAQRLYGNITDSTINSNIVGMDNRFVPRLRQAACSSTSRRIRCLRLRHRQPGQSRSRPLRPRSDEKIYTHLDKASLSFEDRLKLTSNFALIGGIRFEDIELARTAFDADGVLRRTGAIRSPRPSVP